MNRHNFVNRQMVRRISNYKTADEFIPIGKIIEVKSVVFETIRIKNYPGAWGWKNFETIIRSYDDVIKGMTLTFVNYVGDCGRIIHPSEECIVTKVHSNYGIDVMFSGGDVVKGFNLTVFKEYAPEGKLYGSNKHAYIGSNPATGTSNKL